MLRRPLQERSVPPAKQNEPAIIAGCADCFQVALRSWITIGQERVLRGRPDRTPHVVIGEAVGSRRIGHLLHLSCEVVGEFDAGRIRIGRRGQPIQHVVDILNRLILAISLGQQIAHGI